MLDKLMALIRLLMANTFTGQLVIHFNKGTPCKVEKHEYLKM